MPKLRIPLVFAIDRLEGNARALDNFTLAEIQRCRQTDPTAIGAVNLADNFHLSIGSEKKGA